jgi:hypothetical protein
MKRIGHSILMLMHKDVILLIQLNLLELMIGERFIKFKVDVCGMRDAVEKHFTRVIN